MNSHNNAEQKLRRLGTADDTKMKTWRPALLAAAVVVSLAACHKEGPAESAGKSLDNAGQKIQDAVDPPGPAQKVGRAIDDAGK